MKHFYRVAPEVEPTAGWQIALGVTAPLLTFDFLVPAFGIEPKTFRLQVGHQPVLLALAGRVGRMVGRDPWKRGEARIA